VLSFTWKVRSEKGAS